jgi:chemotaxis protein methyltransferase CheR
MRAEDIALVSSICRTRAGLKVAPEKTYLIETRLAPVARRAGLDTIADLIDAIRTRREEPLIWAAVEAMAGGETAFFRDRLPFQHLAEDLVPGLARSRGRSPIRIWSAACATGQEVYSIAMIADQLRAATPGLRIEIAASDLSTLALERAQGGLYNQFEVQRGLPIRQLTRHFDKEEDNWRIAEPIRRMVRWRRINLIAGLKAIGRFDVVFCRYVLAAMTEEAQRRVLEDLAALLPADGYLVLGLEEPIAGLADAFEPVLSAAGLYRPNPKFHAVAAA